MSSWVTRIAEDAAAPIERLGGMFLIKATLFVLALASAGTSAVFLTIALFMALEPWAGTLNAVLSIGAAYLVVAMALAAAGALWGRAGPGRAPPVPLGVSEMDRKGQMPGTKDEAPGPEMAHALDRAAAPLLELLHEHGMERERLALAAGVSVAKELRPWSIIGVVLALGVVIGHFTRRRYG